MTPIKMDSMLVLPIVTPKEVSHMFWCETSFLFCTKMLLYISVFDNQYYISDSFFDIFFL